MHNNPVELTRLRLKASRFALKSYAGQDVAAGRRVVWRFIVKDRENSALIRAAAHF